MAKQTINTHSTSIHSLLLPGLYYVLFLVVAADMKDSDTKWGMVCMVKMSRIFLVVILEFFCL